MKTECREEQLFLIYLELRRSDRKTVMLAKLHRSRTGLHLIFSICLAGLVAACTGVNPASLRRPSSPNEMLLTKPAEWTYQEAPFRPLTFRGTIASGSYVAEYESAEGTYFKGPPGCFSYEAIAVSADDQRIALGKIFEQPCGIFVSKAGSPEMQFYVYQGAQLKLRNGITQNSAPPDPGLIGTQLALNSPAATPSSVAGGAIAGVMVGALIDAERGNLRIYHRQPPSGVLNESMRRIQADTSK